MIPIGAHARGEQGQTFSIRDASYVRHEVIIGKSGAGKSEYLRHRVRQQIMRGGGALVLDAKVNYDDIDEFYSLANTYLRGEDFRLINIDDPKYSHSYNPLLRGDEEAVSSRILNTVESGNNPQSEHFKQQANTALVATLGVVKEMGLAYNSLDLYLLLSNPEVMEWLYRSAPEGIRKTQYGAFLDGYRTRDPITREYVLNRDRINSQLGGIANRLFAFGSGSLGQIMNSYNPEVDIIRAIDNNQILYITCPVLEKPESAIAFAKMFLSDMRSALAVLYRRSRLDLPVIPYPMILDEFSQYAMRQITPMFEMARGARIPLVPAFQTKGGLNNVSPDFAAQILGNTDIKTFLQIGEPDTWEYAARICGEKKSIFRSRNVGRSESSGNRHLDIDPFHNVGEATSESEGLREGYDYRVRPEVFKDLPIGTAICQIEKRIFRLKFPMAKPARKIHYELQHFDMPRRNGLNLMERFDDQFSLINRSSN